ncbi:D-erythronate dehydrogenase [Ahrensia sp. R2A130]|uniref:D-erythronate dehydrogenase n=1 Tax=Ahrensia sp. R2A130 TaxID=744979 RepID=UPI0001E0F12A|nr:D-erythronate dehydrogenase [Ahrensia sp. R2A130]EFL87512.1 NAD-dependent epimerase/dehydratase [Ahrensia sp. R2A130]
MDILVIGAAGMLGSKLAKKLVHDGLANNRIEHLTLVDVVQPQSPTIGDRSTTIDCLQRDLSDDGALVALVADRPDVIFHLAAIVSGEAERDFDKGYRVNFDGTRALLEAIRTAHEADGYCPRLVFTSSLAVFGQPLPDTIPDSQQLTPLTSYGTQKAMCELLVADHTRRGHCEGLSLRLPTIVVRPGLPNAAASGFFSGILREPLAGENAVLPVSPETRHWFASPRAAVQFLIHASCIEMAKVGPHASLSMPGLSATVGDAMNALEQLAGSDAVALIKHIPNEEVATIIAGWPKGFEAERALKLGFVAETSFDEVLQVYLEDDAPSTIVLS